jgi:16S rRNA (uracil1498-N3)-methyltransferase
MQGFFVQAGNISGKSIIITEKSDINHIKNVLRCKKGDGLILKSTENRVFEVVIKSIEQEIINCEIVSSYISDRVLKTNITLAQSIIKSQKQDYIIQKATELGVKRIIPFISRNTVVRFESDKDRAHKLQRWQKIVYESAKQCQRGDIAEVTEISTLDEVLKQDGFDLKVLCSEKAADVSLKKFLKDNPVAEGANVLVIVGPEGGWDDSEIEKFVKAGITPLTLGKLIYRAETAVVAALAQVIYELEPAS